MYKSFRFTKLLYILPALLLVATASKAQVTIGSDEKPVKGAILQLKNINNITDGSANATKGILLPRVALLSTKIREDENGAKDNLATTMLGANTSGPKWDMNAHIGVMVYNTSYCTKGGKGTGIYVWDSNSWTPLQTQPYDSGVTFMTDPRDGEKYLTRDFGSAGIWMTESLRFVPKPDDPVYTNYKHGVTPSPRQGWKGYGYAQGEFKTGQTYTPYNPSTAQSTWDKKGGVFYSAGAALNNADIFMTAHFPADPFDESQTAAGVDQTPRKQGICPPGWHLPSDKEWNDLEKELYNDITEYSYGQPEKDAQGNLIPWNPAWEYGWYDYQTGTEPPGAGRYRLGRHTLNNLISCVEADNGSMYATFGKAAEAGGFNIRAYGNLYPGNQIYDQGRYVGYLTSSVSLLTQPRSSGGYEKQTVIFTRTMGVNGTGIARYTVDDSPQYSVRCKKD